MWPAVHISSPASAAVTRWSRSIGHTMGGNDEASVGAVSADWVLCKAHSRSVRPDDKIKYLPEQVHPAAAASAALRIEASHALDIEHIGKLPGEPRQVI